MRVLITGGAGFIGSHLCERFIRQGRRVVCVDNFITGSRENLKKFIHHKNFSLIEHDISKPLVISGSIEWVLHFASPASPPDYLKYPLETLRVGSLGTHHALGIAKKKKAIFLMASTSEVYGDPLESPQNESYWGNVNPTGVRSVYDEAKRFSEALTLAYHREHRLDTRIVRIFNTYGQRMRLEDGRVIPNFLTQALLGKPLTVYGDGRQTRSYCYVDDLTEGIEKLILSKFHGPVNLGNPNEMTVLKLAETILNMTGSRSKIVYKKLPSDDPKRRCPDIGLAKKTLSWQPQVSLKEGLSRTLPYFRTEILKIKKAR